MSDTPVPVLRSHLLEMLHALLDFGYQWDGDVERCRACRNPRGAWTSFDGHSLDCPVGKARFLVKVLERGEAAKGREGTP